MEFPGCSSQELFARDFCREFVFPVAFELFCHAAIMRASSRTGVSHTLWVLQEPQLSLSLSLCNFMITAIMIVIGITKINFKVQVRKCCSILKPAEIIAAAHFVVPVHRSNAFSLIQVNKIIN